MDGATGNGCATGKHPVKKAGPFSSAAVIANEAPDDEAGYARKQLGAALANA